MSNSKVSKSFSNVWAEVNNSVDFRSSHQRPGLCLMGGAAGFHDAQSPRGLSFTTGRSEVTVTPAASVATALVANQPCCRANVTSLKSEIGQDFKIRVQIKCYHFRD